MDLRHPFTRRRGESLRGRNWFWRKKKPKNPPRGVERG